MVPIGQQVPNFSIHATSNIKLNLNDIKEKNIILYFYPKDDTPGCTTEGQDFRDNYSQFKALNTLIFGISRDSLTAHENFKDKYQFPFDLIADPDETLCQLFDVMKMKNMYGKQVRGIERSTFFLDSAHILRQMWRKVKVKGHVIEVLDKVRQLT